MVRFLVFTATLALGSAKAELLLTPTLADYELEGAKFKRLAFPDGDKNVTYQPPRGWDYSGSANQLTLHPPNKAQAEAIIARFPTAEPARSEDEGEQRLTAVALTLAPKESSGATVISQEKTPIKVSGKETFRVVISYKLFGRAYNRSVLFLNRDHDQLRFQLVATEADFPELDRAFQSSLCTWQNL